MPNRICPSRSSSRQILTHAAAALCVAVIASGARAEDFRWDGGGTTANWTNVFNWEGIKTPGNGGDSDIEFPGNAARLRSVVNESYFINRIDFIYGSLSIGKSFTLDAENGAALTVKGAIRNATEQPQTVNVPITLGGGGSHNVGNDNSGTITFNNPVNLDGGRLASQNGSGGRIVFAGPLGGNGTLEVAGAGTVQLATGNTFAGTFDITGGTLEFATANQLGALTNTITFNQDIGASTTTLRRTAPGTTVLPITVVSSLVEGRLFADQDWTHSATIGGNGGIAKYGGGTLTLNDTLSYKGATRVLAGELIITGNARVPDNRLELAAGARITFTSGISETVGSLAGDGGTVAMPAGSVLTVGLPGGTTPQTNGTGTYAGEILGSTSLVHNGTGALVLKGPSFYNGGTTITLGSIVADDNSGGSATGSGPVEVLSGARLEGDGGVSGIVTVRNGASVSPSSASTPGTGTGSLVVGGLTLDAGAKTRIELNGATAGFTIDQLNVTGNAKLAGATLELVSLPNFNPSLTLQPTPIVTIAGQRTGIFSKVDGVILSPFVSLAVTYDGQAVRVRTARPGDTSLDANINFTDLVTLAQNYGFSETEWTRGDFTGDGVTDFADLVILAQNYNSNALGDASGFGAHFAADWALAQSLAPEPTTLASLIGAAVMTRRRRR